MKKKKLLLLGGLNYLIPLIKKARLLNMHVITCDNMPSNPAHKISDEYYNISILDQEAILELAISLEIDGIMSFAVDPGVYTAAYVAQKLDLPKTGPLSSIKILQNKDLFREYLRKNRFNVPRVKVFSTLHQALNGINKMDLPVMVKPVDSAGSKGVSKIDSIYKLKEALINAFDHSFVKKVIIEEYIESDGYASDSDCFSIDGKLSFISFSSQHFDKNSPNPFTPCGFSWPGTMPAYASKYLSSELQRLVRLLRMQTSIYNVETRIGPGKKPYIMELSPRGGGNRIAEMIELATGVDLISRGIQAAVGNKVPEIPNYLYRGYWGKITLHTNETGSFKNIELDEKLTPYVKEIDVWVREGERIEAFQSANNTIGTIILKAEKSDTLNEIIKNHNNYIKIILK